MATDSEDSNDEGQNETPTNTNYSNLTNVVVTQTEQSEERPHNEELNITLLEQKIQ